MVAAVTRGQTHHSEYSINMEAAAIAQTTSDRVCFIISQQTERSLEAPPLQCNRHLLNINPPQQHWEHEDGPREADSSQKEGSGVASFSNCPCHQNPSRQPSSSRPVRAVVRGQAFGTHCKDSISEWKSQSIPICYFTDFISGRCQREHSNTFCIFTAHSSPSLPHSALLPFQLTSSQLHGKQLR